MLWLKAQAVGCRPSEILGVEPTSYEGYCLDEAVIYFGMVLENELEKAGHRPGKEERKIQAAREKLLDSILGEGQKKNAGYADPALMF